MAEDCDIKKERMMHRYQKIWTSAELIEYLDDLHGWNKCGAGRDDSLDGYIRDYTKWEYIEAMSTKLFKPRKHDEDIADSYVDDIENAPPIIAYPSHDKNFNFIILDGAHRHAAAVIAKTGINALIPIGMRRK